MAEASPPATIFSDARSFHFRAICERHRPAPGRGAGGKGIHTVDDLLHYLPFRYEDRLNPRTIPELRAGEMATVIAEVRNSGLFRTRRMPIFQMTAGQGRTRLKCLWFNATYLRDKFKPGQVVALYGKVEADNRSGELQIIQPQFEILEEPSENGSTDAAEQRSWPSRWRLAASCPSTKPSGKAG